MLTGKNKKKFEKWYKKKWTNNQSTSNKESWFYQLPFEMQIGVLLAYYDSLAVYIRVDYGVVRSGVRSRKIAWKYTINANSEAYQYDMRNEAYKQAFKKADEIINKTLKKWIV